MSDILSIRLETDGFSFSVYNPIRDSVVFSQRREMEPGLSVTNNLKQAFKELDFLSNSYKTVHVSLQSRRFTLIPLDLFEEDKAEELFYYNYSAKENEAILHNILSKNRAVLLYAIDKTLYNFLKDQYGSIQFKSSVTPLAEHFALLSRSGGDKKMYAHIRSYAMELYAYERGHLMLLNSYDYKSVSDCVYYLLYAWKQLAMDQCKDELYISGEKESQKQLLKELQRFIRHISIHDPLVESNKS